MEHKAIEALKAVQIKDPETRSYSHPYELSGGMCHRVVCAIAFACDPRLLIADEPTHGLAVTTQQAVMDLIKDLITVSSTHLRAHETDSYLVFRLLLEKKKYIETTAKLYELCIQKEETSYSIPSRMDSRQ